jgi:hypothetical protein
MSANTVSKEFTYFVGDLPRTLIRFSSPDEGVNRLIGFNAVPSFSVTYTTMPSQLNETLQFAAVVVIPTLVVVIPAIVWFSKKMKKVITTY